METVKLKNGITLVMEKFYNIRSVSIGVFVHNGSMNEIPQLNGISHFIEHMLFKGTKNRSAMDIAVEMDRAGGQLNAYTTKEYTCYYTRVLDTYFDNTFNILADMYFNSLFSPEEVKRELGVINEEIDMYNDTPDDLVHENLQNAVWQNTPLGQPVLGTDATIGTFTGETFKTYMSKHYCADNTVISVTGNIDYDKVIKTAEKYFGSAEKCSDNTSTALEECKYTPSVVTCHRDIEQQHMCIAFKGVSQHNAEDSYTMTLLNTILGGGMSSLLFQKIREEKGLAYSIYSYHSAYGRTGLFTVYAGFNKENTALVKETVLDMLYSFPHTFDNIEMIKNAKQHIINNYLMGLENTSTVMTAQGRAMLIRGKVNSQQQAVEAIERIDIDMLKTLAKRVFVPDMLSVSEVGQIIK